jgi:hypothetical protein
VKVVERWNEKMHDCCKINLVFLRNEQGVDIFACEICKQKYAVYEIEE